jgi:hypothetical protein
MMIDDFTAEFRGTTPSFDSRTIGSTKISTILKIATHKYCTIEPPSSILLIEEVALATPSRRVPLNPGKATFITN